MDISQQEKKPKSGYWYLHYTRECVLCGAGETTKYRIYEEPRPENDAGRYEFVQFVCGDHFC